MLLNVTEIGSPKVDNGVVSGFSSANYLKITDSFDVSTAQSWEVVYKIKTGTSLSAQSVCGHTGSSNYDPFTIDINSSKFQLGLCKSSSSNLLKDQKGTYTVLVDTTYWLKLTFDGSKYVLSYSLDGVDFIEDVVLESTTKIWTSNLVLGRQQGDASEYPFLGSIDLNECYIKINGELWWTGMVEGGINTVRSYMLKRRETKYYKYNPIEWSTPVLTSNGVLGGEQFAVHASFVPSSSYDAYKAMDGNDSTFWQCGTNSAGHSFIFYNPVPIRVTTLFFTFYDNAGKYGIRQGTLYASNDNINWVELKSFKEYTTTWDSFDKTGFYKYYKIAILQGGTYNGYVDLNKLEIVATQGIEVETTKDDYDVVKIVDSFYSLRRKGEIEYYKEVATEKIDWCCFTYNLSEGYIVHYYLKSPYTVGDNFYYNDDNVFLQAVSQDNLVKVDDNLTKINTDGTIEGEFTIMGTTIVTYSPYPSGNLTTTTTELVESTKDDYDVIKEINGSSHSLYRR